jgi:hypothetical protein
MASWWHGDQGLIQLRIMYAINCATHQSSRLSKTANNARAHHVPNPDPKAVGNSSTKHATSTTASHTATSKALTMWHGSDGSTALRVGYAVNCITLLPLICGTLMHLWSTDQG